MQRTSNTHLLLAAHALPEGRARELALELRDPIYELGVLGLELLGALFDGKGGHTCSVLYVVRQWGDEAEGDVSVATYKIVVSVNFSF